MKPTAFFGLLALGTLLFSSKKQSLAPQVPGQPGHGAHPPGGSAPGDEEPDPMLEARTLDFRTTWTALLEDMLSLEKYYQRKGQNEDANLLSKVYVAVDVALPPELKVSATGVENIDKAEADRIFDSLKSRFEELSRSADILGARAAGDEFRAGVKLLETEAPPPPRSLPTV